MKGYKIDFATNTLTMNYKFSAAANQFDTPEYKLVKKIRRDFPELTVVVKAGREKKSARPNARLTYENMEQYIRVYENADELLDVFESVKAMSKSAKSPYKYVCDWFKQQFPNYKATPVYKDGKLTIVTPEAPKIKEFKAKMGKTA